MTEITNCSERCTAAPERSITARPVVVRASRQRVQTHRTQQLSANKRAHCKRPLRSSCHCLSSAPRSWSAGCLSVGRIKEQTTQASSALLPWPAPKRSGVHLDLSTGDSNGPLTACGREPPALGCAQLLPVTVPQRVPCLRAACWQPGGRLGLQKYLLKSMTSYRSVSVCFFPLWHRNAALNVHADVRQWGLRAGRAEPWGRKQSSDVGHKYISWYWTNRNESCTNQSFTCSKNTTPRTCSLRTAPPSTEPHQQPRVRSATRPLPHGESHTARAALPSPRPPSHTPPLGLSPGRALLAQPLRPPPAHRSLRDPAAPLRRTEERPPPLSTATPPHTSAQRSRLGPPRLSGARCRLRRSPLPPAATSGCCPAPATWRQDEAPSLPRRKNRSREADPVATPADRDWSAGLRGRFRCPAARLQYFPFVCVCVCVNRLRKSHDSSLLGLQSLLWSVMPPSGGLHYLQLSVRNVDWFEVEALLRWTLLQKVPGRTCTGGFSAD